MSAWTKYARPLVKTAARAAAAYFTGGASELALRAYESSQQGQDPEPEPESFKVQLATQGLKYLAGVRAAAPIMGGMAIGLGGAAITAGRFLGSGGEEPDDQDESADDGFEEDGE